MATDRYTTEGAKAARACAREYGITDKAEIAALALDFADSFRRNDELRAMAECKA